MKIKRITSLLLCGLLTFAGVAETPVTIMAASDVALNSTNFPDEKFRSGIKYKYDQNKDNVLSRAERNGVSTLNVTTIKGAKNFKGIEFFSNLTTFQCNGMGIAKLDLSKNKKLTKLYCWNNKITSLKIPASLVELYASSNRLVKLPNMRKFTSLKELDLSKNYLTEKELKKKLPTHAVKATKWFKEQLKKQTKIPTPTKVKVSKSGSHGLKISWKKKSGVTGYEVWFATSKGGKYKKVKTVSGASFTHKKLETGKTYYYKVRSYKKFGSNRAYSAYTSPKSKKI